VDLLGEANARDLLGILEMAEDNRTDFIAHMYLRDDGRALAEILTDIRTTPTTSRDCG
jgi:hypothetical protein